MLMIQREITANDVFEVVQKSVKLDEAKPLEMNKQCQKTLKFPTAFNYERLSNGGTRNASVVH